MNSSPRVDAELRAHIRRQEALADLGQQALEGDDPDRLVHDASAAVAETLDNDYCEVLEPLSDDEGAFLRQGVGWDGRIVGDTLVPLDAESESGAGSTCFFTLPKAGEAR